jgi:hypothetical protein
MYQYWTAHASKESTVYDKHPPAHAATTDDAAHADSIDAAARSCPHHCKALLLMKLEAHVRRSACQPCDPPLQVGGCSWCRTEPITPDPAAVQQQVTHVQRLCTGAVCSN